MCTHVVAENSPCDLASVPRTAIDRFLHTHHMVITHAAHVSHGHHARRRPIADLHSPLTSGADLHRDLPEVLEPVSDD